VSREIRVDSIVTRRGQDSSKFYRVSYVSGTAFADAELVSLDGDERVSVPIAELRRVANPHDRRPAILGLPAERPRCAWCNRPLRPDVRNTYSDDPLWRRRIIQRHFNGWRTIEGVFDTNGCAVKFAGASYRGGYRRKR
jgi:hypothetical protein